MNKLLFIVMSLGLATAVHAQGGVVLTNNDYAHAESLLSYGTAPLVDNVMGNPNWLSGDRFWYRVLTAQGSEFVLVDMAKGTRTDRKSVV